MHAHIRYISSILLPACLAAQTPVPLPAPRTSDTVVVQIRVIRGEGAVHTAGARSPSALIVEVTDETGKPVEGAAVNFKLPASGPGGLFSNGLTSDLVIASPDGRASAPAMRCNNISGPFQIRVTAAKGQARAGLVVPQYLSEAQTPARNLTAPPDLPNPGRKWVKVAIIVAGAAAGSVAAGLAFGKRSASSSQQQAAPTALSVGPPVITVGGPQ